MEKRINQVRHCLYIMHIEKNVCAAILETFMNIPGKTKDVKVVLDWYECKGLRLELWAHVKGSKKKEIELMKLVAVTRERAVRRR